jgi:AcrR family transcriptional regulator
MARKSKRKQAPRPAPARPAEANPGETQRTRTSGGDDPICAAFMALLAEKSFETIGYAEIAARAGVSLADVRQDYGSTLAILAVHMKAIDRQVLAAGDTDMAGEPPRERLFDVLMRRIEALDPHKDAVRSLVRSARRNPALAFALNRLAVRSQIWMLTAADSSAAGPRGAIRAQGLAILFASVLRTWLDDDDPGHARTLAALDRALARGQRWSGFLDDACRIGGRLCGMRGRRRRRRDEDEEAIAA